MNSIIVLIPVYDLEYGVIGKWHRKTLPFTLTKRGNIKVVLKNSNKTLIFCRKTGKCLNRKPKRWLVRTLERMMYPNLVEYALLDSTTD